LGRKGPVMCRWDDTRLSKARTEGLQITFKKKKLCSALRGFHSNRQGDFAGTF